MKKVLFLLIFLFQIKIFASENCMNFERSLSSNGLSYLINVSYEENGNKYNRMDAWDIDIFSSVDNRGCNKKLKLDILELKPYRDSNIINKIKNIYYSKYISLPSGKEFIDKNEPNSVLNFYNNKFEYEVNDPSKYVNFKFMFSKRKYPLTDIKGIYMDKLKDITYHFELVKNKKEVNVIIENAATWK
tara:strand:+ start:540 stop:1103 length:564 start_codon:yes stop_codon:yes gene_type:complete